MNTDDNAIPPPPPADMPVRFNYSLVLAEVIFSTVKGVGSHRVQLFSKADVPTFPAARIGQLQNSAAHQVMTQVPDKDFKALEVIFLNVINLGWMTEEEFGVTLPGAPDAPAEPSVGSSNNVVPLQRP